MRQPIEKNKGKRPFVISGICAAAVELGVTRTHLYRVLQGERKSPRIESSEFYRQSMAAKRQFENQPKGHEQ